MPPPLIEPANEFIKADPLLPALVALHGGLQVFLAEYRGLNHFIGRRQILFH